MSRRLATTGLALSMSAFSAVLATAGDIPMPGPPEGVASVKALVVRERTNGKVTLRYKSGPGFDEVTKGGGADPDTIAAEIYLMRGTDGEVASFSLGPGAFDGTSGWDRNDTKEARYRNHLAPGGTTQAAHALVREGKGLKLVAKGLGDVPLDLGPGTDPSLYLSWCVENEGERFCHCSELRECEQQDTAHGRKLVCRAGVSDERCRAVTRAQPSFSASTSFPVLDCCPYVDDDDSVQDIIEYMADLGYGVATGHFETLGNDAPYEQFASPGPHHLVSRFDDGSAFTRLGGQDVILVTMPVSSTDALWSFDVSLDWIVQEQNDEDVPTKYLTPRANLGGSANQANTDFGPDAQGETADVIFSGDQQTIDDLLQAYADTGFGSEPGHLLERVMVVPIPDVQVPDGSGGTASAFSSDELDLPRGLYSIHRRWERRPGRLGEDAIPVLYDAGFPFYIFYRDEDAPRVPVAAPDTFSPAHANFVDDTAGQFDRLVDAVIDHFSAQDGIDFVSDQPLLARNGTESSTGLTLGIFEGLETCLAHGLDCGTDNPQTHYSWPGDSMLLGNTDLYMVVGLDYGRLKGLGGPMAELPLVGVYHVQDPDDPTFHFTPAAEIGIVNDDADDAGQGLVPLDNLLPGKFPPEVRALFPNTFLVQIARPAICLGAPFASGLCLGTDVVADDEPIVVAGRLVLNPATGTKPEDGQVVPWRLLHFEVTP